MQETLTQKILNLFLVLWRVSGWEEWCLTLVLSDSLISVFLILHELPAQRPLTFYLLQTLHFLFFLILWALHLLRKVFCRPKKLGKLFLCDVESRGRVDSWCEVAREIFPEN